MKEDFEALSRRRVMTPSALLRRLVEEELAGKADWERGEVEQATAAQLETYGIESSNARAAAALNMARRIDRDPTAGAANTGQLRALLSELGPATPAHDLNGLQFVRLRAALKLRGWSHEDAMALVDEAVGLAPPGGGS